MTYLNEPIGTVAGFSKPTSFIFLFSDLNIALNVRIRWVLVKE